MAAFRHAAALGFRYLETDVQASRDGVAVLAHDPTLERMFGVPETVGGRSWRELSALRTPGGEPLLRLDEALAGFPEARLNLDVKTDAAVEPLAEAIRRCGALARVCVGSFAARRTLRLRRLLGEGLCWSPARAEVARLWLAGLGLPTPRLDFPAAQIPPSWRGVRLAGPRLLAAAHARGIQVHVWTVDDPAEMKRLLDLGVDGLMSDRPSVLKAVLAQRGLWAG